MASSSATPATYRIIRLALLAGQLLFGAVAWFLLRTSDAFAADDPELLGTLRLIFFVLAAGALGGIWFLRRLRITASDPQTQAQWCIVGWALGEGLAFFGGVYYLLSGSALLFFAGLLAFALAWLLLPIPDAA